MERLFDGLSGDRRALLLRKLRGRKRREAAPPIIPRQERRDRFPLSMAQESIFLAQQLAPASVAFLLNQTLRFAGELSAGLLTDALRRLVERHETLRTCLRTTDEGPVQIVEPAACRVALPIVDLTALPEPLRFGAGRRLVRRLGNYPFDLAKAPLWRLFVVHLDERDHLLALSIHHAVSDEWSNRLLLRELAGAYETLRRGHAPAWRELTVQYGDYALWQRRRLGEGSIEQHLAFWRRTLAGQPPALRLPADRPRPERRVFRSGRRAFFWAADIARTVRAISRHSGATLFMTLLAAYQALLGRYSGRTDVWVGSLVSNRRRRELHGLIGLFADTVVLRGDLGGDPDFTELLARARQSVSYAFAHLDVPFEEILRALSPQRSAAAPRPYRTMLVLLDLPEHGESLEVDGPRSADGPSLTTFEPGGELQTLEDLNFYFYERGSGIGGSVEYNAEIFEATTTRRIAGHLRTLLASLASRPEAPLSRHGLLTPAEQQQLREWSTTSPASRSSGPLHRFLERQADRIPETVALVFAERALSYLELDGRANALARRLAELGAGPEARVGICLERSPEMMIAVLATLKSGGAYVPLDAGYPRERLAAILDGARLTALITRRPLLEAFPTPPCPTILIGAEAAVASAAERLAVAVDPEHPFYVMYTSGSTGRPKGILLPHAVMVNLIHWHLEALYRGRRTLQFSSLNFDVSIHEMFAAWGSGGALEMVPEPLRRDVPALADFLLERGIDKAILPVVVLQQISEHLRGRGPLPLALVELVTTGEQLQVTRPVREFMERLPRARLHNHYGPAETHVVTAYTLPAGKTRSWPSHPPVGRVVHHARIHLLDARWREVAAGVVGELYVGGPVLARGYLDRPGLTAERFVPDALGGRPGARLYRPGDLARYLAGGEIEYLGRIDHQVKIHGVRVELTEIEAALEEHPRVLETVVTVREDQGGRRRLVAYLVADGEPAPGPSELFRFLRQKLPEPMVPAVFVPVTAFPLTPNGKIDLRALPEPGRSRPDLEQPYLAPRDPTEERLAQCWSRALGIDRVGVGDSFFDLGGDSVLCLQIVVEARRYGLAFEVRDLLEHRTVARLAKVCERTAVLPERPIERQPDESAHALTPMQQGLYVHTLSTREGSSYLEHVDLAIGEPLDVDALGKAWRLVVERHPALRSGFVLEGAAGPRQVVHRQVPLSIEDHDLRELTPRRQELAIEEHVRTGAGARRFELRTPPLLRLSLFRVADDGYRLVWTYHHLIADGWSSAVVLAEVESAYRDLRAGRLPALGPARPFRDYAEWLESLDKAASEVFWRHHMAGFERPARLVVEPFGPPAKAAWIELAHRLSGETAGSLREVARQCAATPGILVQAAWAILLSRYCGRVDVVFGNVVGGRSAPLEGIESMVGLLVNNLPFRVRVDPGARLLPWLRQVRDRWLAVQAHEHVPLVDVRRWSAVGAGQPLFDCFLAIENFPSRASSWVRRDWPSIDTGYPLYLMARPGDPFELRAVCSGRSFEPTAARRLLRHLEQLLKGFAADPEVALERLTLLTGAERQQLLLEWNDTETEADDIGFIGPAFRRAAERHTDSVAVVCRHRNVTYRALERSSRRAARRLARLGVGPGVIVALLEARGVELLTAVLAVLGAGGAYLPLEPSHPRRRQIQILERSRASLLLTRPSLWLRGGREAAPAGLAVAWLEELLADEDAGAEVPEAEIPWRSRPQDLAYVIYTSGSTGTPKGAMVEHAGMMNHIAAKIGELGLGARSVVAQNASQCFDVSVWQLLASLVVGGRVHVVPEEEAPDPRRLLGATLAGGVTHLEVVPSLLEYLLAEIEEQGTQASLGRLRWLIPTGEALAPALARRWLGRFPEVPLLNAYGPTECSDDVTHFRLARPLAEGVLHTPVGRALRSLRTFVLDRAQRVVPVGLLGELHVGGVALGRGYLREGARTAEVFVPDGLSRQPGERLYRTGDLARHLADGNVEFRGRIDHQVKVRGHRIEPAEIEAALRQLPGVREALVVTWQPGGDRGAGATPDRRLVAYVSGAAAAGSDAEPWRALLAEKLPASMIPSVLVVLDDFPRLPSGKIDRRGLPDPGASDARESRASPRTPLEETLATIWCDLLDRDQVGLHDDFFELGGNSLMAIRVSSRIRALFGVEVALQEVFEASTLGSLARVVERTMNSEAGSPRPPRPRLAPLLPASSRILPLSFAQERLWFLNRLEPINPAYNIPLALRLVGRLDVAALVHALTAIVRRHGILRTVYSEQDNGPRQEVLPPAPVPVPAVDLRRLPSAVREEELKRLAAASALRPFDLARGSVLRVSLARVDDQDHSLFVTLHHIAADGWSMHLFAREMVALYEASAAGRESPLPELPISYADYAVWQRRWLAGENLEKDLAYWRDRLAGAPPVLNLPADRPRPAQPGSRGGRRPLNLPPELGRRVRLLSRREGTTLFMTLLAAFQTLLSRYTGERDVVVGVPVAGRTQVETEALIGFFVNTLVLRTDVRGDSGRAFPTLRTLLGRVRRATLAAFAHQELPFEKLVEELRPQRDLAHSPIFQVVFVLQNLPRVPPRLRNVELVALGQPVTVARFDLTLQVGETAERLGGAIEYRAELFDPTTVQRMTRHYRRLLEAMADEDAAETRLDALPLLSVAESHQTFTECSGGSDSLPCPEKTLDGLFAVQAGRTPDAVAVSFEGAALSYARLARTSRRLGDRLRRLGIAPEVRVGLFLERTPEMVVAILATLNAGGAYVPLDPDEPRHRLARKIEDSGIAALLTTDALAPKLSESGVRRIHLDHRWPAAEPDRCRPDTSPKSHRAAYVIYTSGSTGEPKGVVVTHHNVVRLFETTRPWFGFHSGDTWTLFHSYAFDFSVWELWGALLHGGRLVVVPYWTSRSHEELCSLVVRERVCVLNQTPSAFRSLRDVAEPGALALRRVIFGGEALDLGSLRPWLDRHGESSPVLVNMYGITETTVHVTVLPIRRAHTARRVGGSLIGGPLPDLEVHLVSAALAVLPLGVTGEIVVAGEGLSRGYLNRPGLTASRFVPHPWSKRAGARLYRSGDLARRLADGGLEYLGRADQQVKIRGFRVELGEVEAALAAYPAVREALAVLTRDGAGNPRLAGYVVAPAAAPSREELNRFLRERLPDPMVPSALVFLERMPLNRNGKVDRGALPPPEVTPQTVSPATPRTPIVELVTGIWADVLGIEPFGPHDNFFDLGGHSLLATQVVSRLRRSLGVEVGLRQLFEHPTVEELSAEIARMRRGDAPAPPAILADPTARSAELSFAQQRLWWLSQLRGASSAYNVNGALRLEGHLDVTALAASLREILRRHEVLRSTIEASDGREPVQVVGPIRPSYLPVADLSSLREPDRDAELVRLAESEAARPFDLARGPMVRITLVRLAARLHVVLLTQHHIVSDAWSQAIIAGELKTLYAAFKGGAGLAEAARLLPDLPLQYRDYARWQRNWLRGEVLERELKYWRERLEGIPRLFAGLADYPRPPVPSFRGAAENVQLSRDLTLRLESLSRENQATLFMTLLAAFDLLLWRHSGQRRFVVATNVAHRTRTEVEPLVGFFVNMLLLPVELIDDPPFTEFLARIRESTLDAYGHQDTPFEKLVEELQPERDPSYNPLFQVVFSLLNAPSVPLQLPGLQLSGFRIKRRSAKFDLLMNVWPSPDGLRGELEYSRDLFSPMTIRNLLDRFGRLLESIVATPEARLSKLDVLSRRETAALATPIHVEELDDDFAF